MSWLFVYKVVIILDLLRMMCPGNCSTHDLYVLVLSPYPSKQFPSEIGWDGGPALFPAVQLATDMINDRPDILPGFTLRLINGDSGCEFYTRATVTFAREARLADQNGVTGIIGPACTTAAITIGGITADKYADLVSITVATGPLLDSDAHFHNMFRLFSSARMSADGLLQLIQHVGWSSVATVVDISQMFRFQIYDSFSEILETAGNYTAQLLPLQNKTVLFSEIRNRFNVIIVFAGPQDSRRALCMALKLDFTFPDYQWIFVDIQVEGLLGNDEYFIQDGVTYNCTKNEMKKAAHQAIIFQTRLVPEDKMVASFSGLNYNEFFTRYKDYYQNHLLKENISELDVDERASDWAAAYFDCMWALALAINMSIPNMKEGNPTHHEITKMIHNNLLAVNFTGLTKEIYFRNDTQETPTVVDVYQVDYAHNKVKKIGYYCEDTLIITGNASFVDPIKMEIAVVKFEAVAIFFPAGLLLFALFVTLHIVYIVFRRYQSIRAQSPQFAHMLFSGCYLFIISALLETIRAANWTGYDDIDSNVFKIFIGTLCNAIFWCLTLSTSLIFGTMCVLSWRIYRIYAHFLNPGVSIADPILASMVLALLIVNVILMVAWTMYDPLLPHFIETSEGLRAGILPFHVYCDCEHFFKWLCIWMLNESVILSVLVLAILNRHVPKKDFVNNTKSHSWTVYTMSLISGLCIPIYFLLSTSDQINTSYIFFQIFTLGSALSAFILIFLPPLIPLVRDIILKIKSSHY